MFCNNQHPAVLKFMACYGVYRSMNVDVVFHGACSTSNCLTLESHRYTIQATQFGCEYSRERVIANHLPFHVHNSRSRMVCSLRRQRVIRSRMGEEFSVSENSACLILMKIVYV